MDTPDPSTRQTVRAEGRDSERLRELQQRWRTLGIDETALVPDSRGTVGRQYETTIGAAPTLEATEVARRFRRDGAADELIDLDAILGEGAMGIVTLAEQPLLRRQVAVKQLRPQARSEAAVGALLREAWISGNLEHPNIVPIHALHDGDESPLIVMKRIEGTSWDAVLRDKGTAARFRIEDRLEWHLNVLMRVCHAVHFAHSRGIVHLDLKPENVMLGEFGETYVVDWGLAASIRDDRPPWMPYARDIRTVVGTPVYLSPEQALGDGERFGPETDVYVLGAILHEIVTGDPLHLGETVMDSLASAWESTPRRYKPAVPPELVAIIHQATAPEPEDRFRSAEALRQALEDFLRHRSSNELVREALERLARIRPAMLDDNEGLSQVELSSAVRLQRDVAECRFGLQQALRIWADNPAARAALQEVLTLVARAAIDDGDWRRAAEALDELPEPDPELEEAVRQLRERLREERQEVRELRDLQRHFDLDVHRNVRVRIAFWGGLVWVAYNLVSGLLYRSGDLPLDYPVLLAWSSGTLAIYFVAVYLVRDTLLTTRINRQAMFLLGVGLGTATVLWAACAIADVPLLVAIALSGVSYITFICCMTVFIDRRAGWALGVQVPVFLWAVANPAYAFEMGAFLGGVTAVTLGWVWRRPVAGEGGAA